MFETTNYELDFLAHGGFWCIWAIWNRFLGLWTDCKECTRSNHQIPDKRYSQNSAPLGWFKHIQETKWGWTNIGNPIEIPIKPAWMTLPGDQKPPQSIFQLNMLGIINISASVIIQFHSICNGYSAPPKFKINPENPWFVQTIRSYCDTVTFQGRAVQLWEGIYVCACVCFGTFDWNRYRGNLDETVSGQRPNTKSKWLKQKNIIILWWFHATFNLYPIETLVIFSHFRGKRQKNWNHHLLKFKVLQNKVNLIQDTLGPWDDASFPESPRKMGRKLVRAKSPCWPFCFRIPNGLPLIIIL